MATGMAAAPARARRNGGRAPAHARRLWQHPRFLRIPTRQAWARRAPHHHRTSPVTDTLISTQWLGYLAATLATGSLVPQALHTFRSNDLAGISLGM